MATGAKTNTSRVIFAANVRFIRARESPAGFVSECLVCGEMLVAQNEAGRDAQIEEHRRKQHVVMVYPYGVPVGTKAQQKARQGVS